MKKYRYLYIDDENDPTTAAIADGLKINDWLDVVLAEPKDFKQQKADFTNHLNEFDGVILDLRLDGIRLDISYNAPALAQELRMMAVEGTIKSCPIILCSTEEKMKATYDVDQTSHDLFDYKFHKQPSAPWEKFARKINSLAEGYYTIIESKFDINDILQRKAIDLDSRVLEKFSGYNKSLPVSEYALFVIKNLFHHPGPLIKERLLAGRLGIDISKSGNAWSKLLDVLFRPALYTGVFSTGWTRWWADIVVDIFKKKAGKRLSTLTANERVQSLVELTGIKELVPATPLPRAKSSNFWTICEYHKMPIDPLEAFVIHSSIEPKSWQENKYISLDAVLNKRGPRPHSSEIDRIELIKKSLSEQ